MTPLGADYRRLWFASALSNLGDGVFQIALPLLALRITRSPGWIAGLQLAFRFPWMLFTLHAGALADRLDRRRTMVSADLIRAVLIGSLAALVVLEQFVGPPLGGLLAGTAVALAFAGSAAVYLVATVGLATMAGRFKPRRAGGTPRRLGTDIAEGLRYLARHRLLRTVAFMVGVNLMNTAAL